jgi:thioredoxin 1
MAVVDVTDATFSDVVLASAKPVVVDYWADWCAPCRQLSPIIEELSTELGEQVTFVKMDTNTNTQTPLQQGVMSLPTIQIFLGGQLVKQFVGAKPKSAFRKALDEFI